MGCLHVSLTVVLKNGIAELKVKKPWFIRLPAALV